MRSRRSVLRSTATLGMTVSAAGLAGCTVDVGDPDADPDDPDGTDDTRAANGSDDRSDDNGDRETDSEELEEFRAELAELISDLHEVAHNPDVTLDDRGIRQRVEGLDSSLEELRNDPATRGQGEQLQTLDRLARLLDSIVDAMNGISDGFDEFVAMLEAVENEEFPAAEYQLEVADNEIPRVERIKEQFAELQPEFGKFDEIDATEIEETIDRVDTISTALREVNRGMRTWIRGYEPFLEATTAYDEGNYRDASRVLNRPVDIFSQAVEELRQTRDETPAEIWEAFEIFLCLAESYEDAAHHYRAAANALQDGDEETGLEEEQQAEEALDRCI